MNKRLNPQRQREIEAILALTASGVHEDMLVLKHVSPSLLRIWLEQCLAEIEHLRKQKRSEEDTKEM